MDQANPSADKSWPSATLGWYAVAVLLVAYTLSYVDRAILTMLIEPIEADFHVNDTQLSLLYGAAFVIFYVTLGIPLGYLADKGGRKRIVIASITLWSFMTAACGLTRSFGQLFLTRMGVGVGEAGLSPASYSLISDYFPPKRRSAPLGVYTLGIYLGTGIAAIGGGYVVKLVGQQPSIVLPVLGAVRSWQAVFFIVGAPGLLVALLMMTLREPPRRLAASEVEHPGFWKQMSRTLKQIGQHKAAYGWLTVGFSFLGVPFNVATLWARPYLTRHFGLTPEHAAYWFGGAMVLFATSGITIGSQFCDRLQTSGRKDATIRIGRLAALIVLAPLIAFPLAPSVPTAIAALALVLFFGAFAFGAAPASLQNITPNRMRATVSGIYLVLINLVGIMAGPTATGFLTDYVFHDPKAVGLSAAIVGVTSALIAAGAFSLAIKPYAAAAETVTGPAE